MIEVKIFTFDYIEELQRKVLHHNEYKAYQEDTFPYNPSFPKGSSKVFLPDDFELAIPVTGNTFDLENSIKLYENLSGMNETKASDARLWIYLTHVKFWNYMKVRWPLEDVKNIPGRISDRYHLRYLKLESLVRNGIARLWWFTHLTVDPDRKDKYELTKVLLSKQDILVGILERSFGTNRNIRFALLEFLYENPDIAQNENKWRDLFKKTNLLGGVKNLPYLSIAEILMNLEQVKSL